MWDLHKCSWSSLPVSNAAWVNCLYTGKGRDNLVLFPWFRQLLKPGRRPLLFQDSDCITQGYQYFCRQHISIYDTAEARFIPGIYVTHMIRKSRLLTGGRGRHISMHSCSVFSVAPCLGWTIGSIWYGSRTGMHERGSCCMNLTMLLAQLEISYHASTKWGRRRRPAARFDVVPSYQIS